MPAQCKAETSVSFQHRLFSQPCETADDLRYCKRGKIQMQFCIRLEGGPNALLETEDVLRIPVLLDLAQSRIVVPVILMSPVRQKRVNVVDIGPNCELGQLLEKAVGPFHVRACIL